MRFKQVLLAAVAACTLAGAGVALAQPMGHHGEGMEFLHGLKLTDAQQAQLHQIHKAGWTQMRPLMQQEHVLHGQIMSQLLAPGTVTADQLAPLVQQEQGLRAQLDQIRLSEGLQMRAVLTPEQLAQASTTFAKLETLHEQEHAVIGGAE